MHGITMHGIAMWGATQDVYHANTKWKFLKISCGATC